MPSRSRPTPRAALRSGAFRRQEARALAVGRGPQPVPGVHPSARCGPRRRRSGKVPAAPREHRPRRRHRAPGLPERAPGRHQPAGECTRTDLGTAADRARDRRGVGKPFRMRPGFRTPTRSRSRSRPSTRPKRTGTTRSRATRPTTRGPTGSRRDAVATTCGACGYSRPEPAPYVSRVRQVSAVGLARGPVGPRSARLGPRP